MQLKSESADEFTRWIEDEVIPVLRKQEGFLDEIAFVRPGRREAIRFTLWESKENAEAYHNGAYPELLKTSAKVIEGTPRARSFEVSNSTWHKIASS
jgi:hypothetical protein